MSNNFETLSCVPYTIFSVVKLDLCIRELLLDHILALKKTTRTPRVHLVMSSVMIMNITILNIHIVNGSWVQAIIHFVHKQPNSIPN